MSFKKRRPDFGAYLPIFDSAGEQKWLECGAAWESKEGSISVKLDTFPVQYLSKPPQDRVSIVLHPKRYRGELKCTQSDEVEQEIPF